MKQPWPDLLGLLLGILLAAPVLAGALGLFFWGAP